jgi:hypothetical protein
MSLLMLAPLMLAASDNAPKTFKGVISDSQCATNVHSVSNSHKEMLAQHTMGNTEADCVRKCVEDWGGEYVLLTKDKKVWHLSDQQSAAHFAAQQVVIEGEAEPDHKTIRVSSIKSAQ